MRRQFLETFYRIAASGLVPRRLLAPVPELPPAPPRGDPSRPLAIEIVSHCWRYHSLLEYQLSSLVLHAVGEAKVTMTVFHSPEDRPTREVLDYFGGLEVEGVRWNPRPLPRERLFRRAIGRNLAAKESSADWVWFSDCDVIFHEGALDRAARVLRNRDDVLVFPREHFVTDLLEPGHDLLGGTDHDPRVVDIDPGQFHPELRDRAVGGFQIVRGDVARAVGYCDRIGFYQEPLDRWQKTFEDRTFRWLLGTEGTPVEIPGLYRIRHLAKGRKSAAELPDSGQRP